MTRYQGFKPIHIHQLYMIDLKIDALCQLSLVVSP